MARARSRASRPLLLWVVALVAALQALLEAGEAWLNHRRDLVLLWSLGAVLTFVLARILETFKDKGRR